MISSAFNGSKKNTLSDKAGVRVGIWSFPNQSVRNSPMNGGNAPRRRGQRVDQTSAIGWHQRDESSHTETDGKRFLNRNRLFISIL
ncbi:hypothetical protein DUE52_00770 [Larkinella punicea]|uniref:Uncharacterized protein n=1 Tax=Larkinella punicea TaxID=2315727 RepID=A0A368JV21_9BACT|nr:hypothetical protein DUE52_00770 [Larkinella punicea]